MYFIENQQWLIVITPRSATGHWERVSMSLSRVPARCYITLALGLPQFSVVVRDLAHSAIAVMRLSAPSSVHLPAPPAMHPALKMLINSAITARLPRVPSTPSNYLRHQFVRIHSPWRRSPSCSRPPPLSTDAWRYPVLSLYKAFIFAHNIGDPRHVRFINYTYYTRHSSSRTTVSIASK